FATGRIVACRPVAGSGMYPFVQLFDATGPGIGLARWLWRWGPRSGNGAGVVAPESAPARLPVGYFELGGPDHGRPDQAQWRHRYIQDWVWREALWPDWPVPPAGP